MPDIGKVIKGKEHLDAIMEVATHLTYQDYGVMQDHCLALLAMLKEQGAVVRCKDCKWYDEQISMCDNCGLPREQTFFCADGKHKQNDA